MLLVAHNLLAIINLAIAAASLISFIPNFSDAFPPIAVHGSVKTRGSASSLKLFFDNGDHNNDKFPDYDEDDHQDPFDIEQARQHLEELMTVGGGESIYDHQILQTAERPKIRSPTYSSSPSSLPALDVVLPPPPPLTTIERERREAEIQLLARLAEGDEGVSDLWTLWFGERGSEAAQQLLMAEELTGEGPQSWQRAEDILRDLIETHGVFWVEPVNRLATLYYMQGRLDEAETLCQIVLAVKPWHFGALSGIVMIYAAQADASRARLWAASRLPTCAPTGENRRRKAWAENAVKSAKESLEDAEKRVKQLFGAPDDYATKASSPKNVWNDDDGDLAWQ